MEIRTEIPEAKPTDPDLSDADSTIEYVPRAHSGRAMLPPPVMPPKRSAPPKRKISSRQLLLVAAAIGTWAFFVSLASLAAFGAVAFVHAQSNQAALASIAVPVASPREAPKHARFIAEPVPPRAHAVDTSDDSQESTRSSSRFGILRFAHATNGALVDGEPRRVTGDALFLSCGAHRIRTSRSGSRTVRVPCGKTVTL